MDRLKRYFFLNHEEIPFLSLAENNYHVISVYVYYLPRSSFRGAERMMFGVLYIHHSLGFKQHPNWKIMVSNYLGGGNSKVFC